MWNDKDFTQRAITALGLFALVLSLFMVSSVVARDVVLLIVIIGSTMESFNLLGKSLISELFFIIIIGQLFPSVGALLVGLAWIIITLHVINRILGNGGVKGVDFSLMQAMALYGVYGAFSQDPVIIFKAIIIVISVDIFSYVGGRVLGQFYEVLPDSPGKSLEGFVSGALVAAVIGLVQGFMFWQVLVIVLLAMIGDAWASAIKRFAKVKDSGYILPGHGGILDRTDSWLPVLFLVRFF